MTGKDPKAKIEGVGKDAEIESNAQGGLQSKSPAYLHLVDPDFLNNSFNAKKSDFMPSANLALAHICDYMKLSTAQSLYSAMTYLQPETVARVMTIGKVLKYGVTESNNGQGYPVNNWRLIPREQHINHALVHIIALIAKDEQDDHLDHALCRLHMAIATEETEGFSYTKPCK